MIPTLQDLQRIAFDAAGFTSVDLPSAWMEWAVANGATATDLHEAIRQVLQTDGDTAIQLNDLWHSRLTDLEYTGTLPDMMYQFWADGGHPFVLGATFDGTSDYLLRGSDLIGNIDGTVGMFVARMRFNGGDSSVQQVYNTTNGRVDIRKRGDNKISAILKDSAGVILASLTSADTIIADGNYHNIAICWNTAVQAENIINIDGSVVTAVPVPIAGDIDYTDTNHFMMATSIGSSKVNADVNFVYVNFTETLVFSSEANYNKFFDSQGNPILNPYGTGSEATGSVPVIYQVGDYSQWENNKGTGGGFTVVGALARPVS